MDLKPEVYFTKLSQGTTGSVYCGSSEYSNGRNEKMSSHEHYKTTRSSEKLDKLNSNRNQGVAAQKVRAPPGFVKDADGNIFYSQILVHESENVDSCFTHFELAIHGYLISCYFSNTKEE